MNQHYEIMEAAPVGEELAALSSKYYGGQVVIIAPVGGEAHPVKRGDQLVSVVDGED